MRRTIVIMSSLDKYSPIRGCLNTATQLPPSAMSGQVSLDLRETDAYALNMSPSMRGLPPPPLFRLSIFPRERDILSSNAFIASFGPLALLVPSHSKASTGEWSEGPTCHATSYGLFGSRKSALTEESLSLMTRNGKLLGRISRLVARLLSLRKVNFACAKARAKLLRTCSDSPIHGRSLL